MIFISQVYSKPDLDEQEREINLLSIMFIVIGVVSAVTIIFMVNNINPQVSELFVISAEAQMCQ